MTVNGYDGAAFQKIGQNESDGATFSKGVTKAFDGSNFRQIYPLDAPLNVTEDLVAWYRFEDGDARDYTATYDARFRDTTAYDGVINGATHQTTGGVTDFNSGSGSGVFDFDGTDDYIGGPPGKFTSELTVMCWFNGSGKGSGNEFYQCAGLVNSERSGFGEGDYGIGIFDDGSLIAGIGPEGSSNDENIVSSSAGYDDGAFHHLAFAWSNGGELVMYIDGELESSQSVESGEVNESADIGRTPSQDRYYTGLIDDVRLYESKLTESQINAIYQETKP